MEKMGEDEFKGLEAEIDSAIDRLFVEKEREKEEGLTTGFAPKEWDREERLPVRSAPSEPSHGAEEKTSLESSISPPSKPLSFFRLGERMETQLLSLEWEITKENLHNTKEEVLALQRIMREKPEITAILNLMEKVINRMIGNDESISPPWIKFLMDSKETIKLLMRKESDNEIDIYKQLAYAGIEARFFRLEGLKDTETRQPALTSSQETEGTAITMAGRKEIREILNKMSLFLDKMDETLKKIDTRLSGPRQETRNPLEQILPETQSSLVNVTVFKVDEKLFGVESDKVFRLFKVPSSFHSKYVDQEIIRLKDLKVRVIDLKRIFSIQGDNQRGEMKILTVKANGEYKGLMVDEVLRRLSTRSEFGTEQGEYFIGKVRWTYQQQPVEVPILDLKKF